MTEEAPSVLKGEKCPMCGNKTLTLTELAREVPYFGKTLLFSMNCSSCKYHKADIESTEQKDPCKYVFEVNGKDDMDVKIVKSAESTVKIPHVGEMTPGPASNGFITNVEGLLTRMKDQVESLKESEEDDELKKKAKSIIKKLNKVIWGNEKLKIIIEDPTGNSAILCDKAEKTKLKVK